MAKIINQIRFFVWRVYRFKDRPSLEIHVADHCNLNCVGCTHYSPISETNLLDINKLKNDLELLKKSRLSIFMKEIRLLGGEPLLHPEIDKIIKTTREFFPKKKIIIVTNGILLNKENQLLEDTCKDANVIIKITKYPVLINFDSIIKRLKNKGVKCEIYGDRCNSDSFFLSRISLKKKSKWENYFHCFEQTCMQLKDGKIYTCPQSAYSYILNKKFSSEFKLSRKDYLDLKSTNFLDFIKFKFSPKPFCGYCVFPRKKIPWKLSDKASEEWII